MNNVQKIIKEICDEEEIEFDLVSKEGYETAKRIYKKAIDNMFE